VVKTRYDEKNNNAEHMGNLFFPLLFLVVFPLRSVFFLSHFVIFYFIFSGCVTVFTMSKNNLYILCILRFLFQRCYPGSQIALDFAITDILDYFSDIARLH
jgi:hypothetical protein